MSAKDNIGRGGDNNKRGKLPESRVTPIQRGEIIRVAVLAMMFPPAQGYP